MSGATAPAVRTGLRPNSNIAPVITISIYVDWNVPAITIGAIFHIWLSGKPLITPIISLPSRAYALRGLQAWPLAN